MSYIASMKSFSLFPTPQFKAVCQRVANAIFLDSRVYIQWILFLFQGPKREGKNKTKIKRKNPEAKMAFPLEGLPGHLLLFLFTRFPPSSGPEGPPPARGWRLPHCAASAYECAGAAAGRGGWRAGPPGSSRRTGSDCRQRRSPASERDWPGMPPAGYLCPHGNKNHQPWEATADWSGNNVT